MKDLHFYLIHNDIHTSKISPDDVLSGPSTLKLHHPNPACSPRIWQVCMQIMLKCCPVEQLRHCILCGLVYAVAGASCCCGQSGRGGFSDGVPSPEQQNQECNPQHHGIPYQTSRQQFLSSGLLLSEATVLHPCEIHTNASIFARLDSFAACGLQFIAHHAV